MAEHNSAYQGHPIRGRADHFQQCLPLSMHGDGVAISGQGRTYAKNAYVWTWCSLLGKGATLGMIVVDLDVV